MKQGSENEGPIKVLDVINGLDDEQDRLGYVTSIQILLGMAKHMEIHWGELSHSVGMKNASLEELRVIFLFLKDYITRMVDTTIMFDESAMEKKVDYLKEEEKSGLDIR